MTAVRAEIYSRILPAGSEIADVTEKKNAVVLRVREDLREYRVAPVIKGLRVVPAVPVMMGLRVLRVVPAVLDTMGLRVLRVVPAARVLQVLQVLLALPAQLERKAFQF
jgi:hypothetical protein